MHQLCDGIVARKTRSRVYLVDSNQDHGSNDKSRCRRGDKINKQWPMKPSITRLQGLIVMFDTGNCPLIVLVLHLQRSLLNSQPRKSDEDYYRWELNLQPPNDLQRKYSNFNRSRLWFVEQSGREEELKIMATIIFWSY